MSKAYIPLFLILIVIFAHITAIFHPVQAQKKAAYSQEKLIIKFKDKISQADKDRVYTKLQAKLERRLAKLNSEVVKIPSGKVDSLLNEAKNDPAVEYAEPDYIADKSEIPSDPYYSQEWGLAKINAPKAWDVTHGDSSVKIAIVDTGIDQNHPDIAAKIVGRANFTTDSDADGDGHGTHVAGIASAITNNGVGVAGVGYNTQLLSVKALDNTGSGYYSWIADGITWAADNGAKVINMSLGGSADSQTLHDAVDYAWNKGVVVVAAAGNDNSSAPEYPGYYTNAIAVAATDSSDNRASFSNYGDWVDIAAPGVSIYSLYKGSYAYLSGTSMTTPFVSGLAGLVAGYHPDWSNAQIRNKIQSSADAIAGTGTYFMNGRINACNAVDCNGTSQTPSPTQTPTPTPTATPTPTPTTTLAPAPSAVNGLNAIYFNNSDFSGNAVSRIDPNIAFNWGTGSPATTIDKDTFSVRWTGKIMPRQSKTYTFFAKVNDGVRLWVNNQLLIDSWINRSIATEVSGSIPLIANQKYDFRMDFYENTGSALAQLRWKIPGSTKQIIPKTSFFTQ